MCCFHFVSDTLHSCHVIILEYVLVFNLFLLVFGNGYTFTDYVFLCFCSSCLHQWQSWSLYDPLWLDLTGIILVLAIATMLH